MRKLVEPAAARHETQVLGVELPHESSRHHVEGTAQYVDDVPLAKNALHVACGWAPISAGKILSADFTAVAASEGVVDVCSFSDVPGSNDVSPVFEGDVLFAHQEVAFHGQTVFAVAAESRVLAARAVKLAKFELESYEPRLSAADAIKAGAFVRPTKTFVMGDVDQSLAQAAHRVERAFGIHGQEHFYLEGQVAVATPQEDGGVNLLISSQHPSEVQQLVASTLAVPLHKVAVTVRRMGGAFGGKETQAAPLACIAALFAVRTQRTVKYRMPRRDDMVQTGKRHHFESHYRLGVTADGVIEAADITLAARCGYSADLSEGIVDRAMFHADNAYSLNQARITGYRCHSNTVSSTAFRGFGGPQGMLTIEAAMDDIAADLKLDPLEVRLRNLYRPDHNETPYGQRVTDFRLRRMMTTLSQDADYSARRERILAFNVAQSRFCRGIALTPVKFGISFTATHLNQAGALIHIYSDGSVHLNHGGTEMGQGLLTKVQQVVAAAFGLTPGWIAVSAAETDKVPNTSPTAASSGTDLNAMAALDAVAKLKVRLHEFLEQSGFNDEPKYCDGVVICGEHTWPWPELVQMAYLNRVSLSATGFYKTPDIHFDAETRKGRPFYYYSFGAACSEVIVDRTTGEYRVSRVDICHDVGRSINPALDRGQIEGGFVQGMGWLTTEELIWGEDGVLLSNSPSNYKIPTAADVPDQFSVSLYQEDNPEATVYHSKAVGEPPLMLAISVWCALRDACRRTDGSLPQLDAPATPEAIYWAINSATENAREGK